MNLVEGLAAGKSVTRAAIEAGYSPDHPENEGQAGYQALKAVQERARDAMDRLGWTLTELIEKHLSLVIEARETKFFPFRKIVQIPPTKEGESPTEEPVQVIQRVNVVNLMTKAAGLDIAFKLRGDYAPKQVDFDPDEGAPIKVINIGGIPRYNDA